MLKGGKVVASAKLPSAESGSRGGDVRSHWKARLGRKAAVLQDGWQREPLRFLAYCLIAASFVFMVIPWIDLAVSGWFFAPDGGFPLARNSTMAAIRDVNRLVPRILLPAMAVIVVVHAFSTRPGWLPRPHQALYVFGVYAIGSGLVVSLLKDIVGRARPDDTIAFGGNAVYTIPWQLSDACTSNCSFSSGEAVSAAAMMSAVMLAPAPMRRPLFWTLAPLAILFSLLRIAFGKHFLSDVVVSWVLVAMVAVVLWRWFVTHGETIDRAVTGSGLPLARSLGRYLGNPAR